MFGKVTMKEYAHTLYNCFQSNAICVSVGEPRKISFQAIRWAKRYKAVDIITRREEKKQNKKSPETSRFGMSLTSIEAFHWDPVSESLRGGVFE